MVTLRGFEVQQAMDGQEAVDCCEKSNYDVITMDLEMPRMGGVEAIALIKKTAPRGPRGSAHGIRKECRYSHRQRRSQSIEQATRTQGIGEGSPEHPQTGIVGQRRITHLGILHRPAPPNLSTEYAIFTPILFPSPYEDCGPRLSFQSGYTQRTNHQKRHLDGNIVETAGLVGREMLKSTHDQNHKHQEAR